jgi:predicted Zn-dependent protease
MVLVEDLSQAEVRFANNGTTTNGTRRNRRVTVVRTLAVAGGMGIGTAARGGDPDIDHLVEAATADAAAAPPAEDAALLISPDEAPSPAMAGGPFDDPPASTDVAVLGPVLADLAGAFERARRSGSDRVLAGFAEHGASTLYLGTSTGVRLRWAQSTGALHMVARSDDGTRSAWVGAGTDHFDDVSVPLMEERLVRRLEQARHRIDVDAGRYEVVLPPEATADMMVALLDAMGGHDAEDGRTVFSGPNGTTRIGERLASLPFELRSDPLERGLSCQPFVATGVSSADMSVFDNGLAIGRTRWIEDGRLARLRYHRTGAARSNAAVTPSADNLVLTLPGATASTDDLVARTEHGLLLTCLWYIREVDPTTLLLTGLTRDGVYVVEDGAIVGAANNFRFNESPVDLLARATEASTTVRALGREFGEWLNRTAMPALRIPDFNMSSVSQAS